MHDDEGNMLVQKCSNNNRGFECVNAVGPSQRCVGSSHDNKVFGNVWVIQLFQYVPIQRGVCFTLGSAPGLKRHMSWAAPIHFLS